MRKAILIIIAVILALAVSGCKSAPAAQDNQSKADVINARSIATTINVLNDEYRSSTVPIPDDATLEDAKEIVGENLWPAGLSDDEERAAWELIEIKDGVAEVKGEG